MALAQSAGNLIAFPRADLRHLLGAAVKRHRLIDAIQQSSDEGRVVAVA